MASDVTFRTDLPGEVRGASISRMAALGTGILLALAAVGCESPRTSPSGAPASATILPSTSAPPTVAPTASPQAPAPFDPGRVRVTLEPYATVEGGPLALSAPSDGSDRLLVASQDGRVWIIEHDRALPEPMLDIGARITSGGERGLLGLAVHPRFPTDDRVFVDYTDLAGDTVVSSFTLDPGDGNRLDPGSERVILRVDQPYANHNGGALAFGPDGFLYVSLGDGGSGGDPHGNGQSLDTLLAKILRLDVDHATAGRAYAIPDGNPFAASDGRDEIWLTGLRNPWRISFDRLTGDLWIGDVGQGAWEEVDVAPAGVGGLNFGWNVREGAHCFRGGQCSTDGLTEPVSEYDHDLGCTIIGGHVYRGTAHAVLLGGYLFADYCTGRIFAIDSAARGMRPAVEVGSTGGGVSAFGEDAAGELYVANLDGTISRVVGALR